MPYAYEMITIELSTIDAEIMAENLLAFLDIAYRWSHNLSDQYIIELEALLKIAEEAGYIPAGDVVIYPDHQRISGMTKEERLAAVRARAVAKRQAAETDGASEARPKSEMTPEERVAAARARTAAKRQAAETDGASETRPKSEMTPEERVAAARARTRARQESAENSDSSNENKPEEGVTG